MNVDLLAGGALALEVPDALEPLVREWVPARRRARGAHEPAARAVISVLAEASRVGDDDGTRLLSLHSVRAFSRAPDAVRLVGDVVMGDVHLDTRRAVLRVGDRPGEDVRGELEAALTIAAALLIGRDGGALVHAAGVVDPGGAAWLLPADAYSGKSTTCASLVDAGWRYLADDQVVLHRAGDGGVVAEGWPRVANLDAGWEAGVVTGRREPVNLAARWLERWCASAPVRGVILPTVKADVPTTARLVPGADALAALVRQSPWLVAGGAASRTTLALLADAAGGGAIALTLGMDSYRRGDVLIARIEAVAPTRVVRG